MRVESGGSARSFQQPVKRSPFFGPERFTYEPEHNRYLCPAGQVLNYGGRSHRNHAWT